MQDVAEVWMGDGFLAEIAGADRIPFPGGGATAKRFGYLADVASRSVVLARLVEGHLDALAILAEAGREAPHGAVLGVWAASSGASKLLATPAGRGWHIQGIKPYASGAST